MRPKSNKCQSFARLPIGLVGQCALCIKLPAHHMSLYSTVMWCQGWICIGNMSYHASATRYEGKAGNDTPKPRNQMFFPIVIAAKVDSPESTHLQSAPLKLTDGFILLCYVRHNIKIQYQVDHFTTNVSRSKAHLNDKKSKTLALFMERNWLYVWTSSCMTYRAEAF